MMWTQALVNSAASTSGGRKLGPSRLGRVPGAVDPRAPASYPGSASSSRKQVRSSGEQFRRRPGELHIGPGIFVAPKKRKKKSPNARNIEIDAVFILRDFLPPPSFERTARLSFRYDSCRPGVGLDRAGDLQQLACGGFRAAKGTVGVEFTIWPFGLVRARASIPLVGYLPAAPLQYEGMGGGVGGGSAFSRSKSQVLQPPVTFIATDASICNPRRTPDPVHAGRSHLAEGIFLLSLAPVISAAAALLQLSILLGIGERAAYSAVVGVKASLQKGKRPPTEAAPLISIE